MAFNLTSILRCATASKELTSTTGGVVRGSRVPQKAVATSTNSFYQSVNALLLIVRRVLRMGLCCISERDHLLEQISWCDD